MHVIYEMRVEIVIGKSRFEGVRRIERKIRSIECNELIHAINIPYLR